jgi:Fe2+ transport system protein FeoA
LEALAENVPGSKRKPTRKGIDKDLGLPHTETMLQLSGNSAELENPLGSLVDLRKGDSAVLDRIDLPGDDARRLMELGFLPGTRVIAGCSAPGGDPRVFQVDGSEIALRRATARQLRVRSGSTLHKSQKAPRIV